MSDQSLDDRYSTAALGAFGAGLDPDTTYLVVPVDGGPIVAMSIDDMDRSIRTADERFAECCTDNGAPFMTGVKLRHALIVLLGPLGEGGER